MRVTSTPASAGFEIIGPKKVARLERERVSGAGWNGAWSLVVEIARAEPERNGLDVGGTEHSPLLNGRAQSENGHRLSATLNLGDNEQA